MRKTRPPVIIGLVGPSGAGKTTICEYLEKEYHFVTRHVAKPLKDAFCAMFNCSTAYTERPYIDQPQDFLGGVTPRVVLEHLGTKLHDVAPMALPIALQKAVTAMIGRYGETHILVDGIRRESEADMLHTMGGVTWRLNRGEIDPDKPCDLSQDLIVCDHSVPAYDEYPELYAHLDERIKMLLGG